jgi:hypothetical protein
MTIPWLPDRKTFGQMTPSSFWGFFSGRPESLQAIDQAIDAAHAAIGAYEQYFALQTIVRLCDRWLFQAQKEAKPDKGTEKIKEGVEELKQKVTLCLPMLCRPQMHAIRDCNQSFCQDPWAFAQRNAIRTLSLMPDAVKTATPEDPIALPQPPDWKPPRWSIESGSKVSYDGALQLRQQFERWVAALGDHAQFDLETTFVGGEPSLDLRIVFPEHRINPKGNPIDAYWLPYIMPSMQRTLDTIPRVTLKRLGPPYTIMFTGATNGCSLVVTQPPHDPGSLWVFHDSVHDRETFENEAAGRVLLRLDYEDSRYTYSEGENVNSFNFLYYQHGQWFLVCQPQIIDQFGNARDIHSTAERARLNPNKPPFQVPIP